MQFLKAKFTQFKQYSKSIIGQGGSTQNSPKKLLQRLLKDKSDSFDKETYQELARLSIELERSADIVDFIVLKLDHFQYEAASVKQTQKLMDATIYLLKNGNKHLGFDLKYHIDLIKKMQELNSNHFQAKTNTQAKNLNYQIEIIKQRAKYIEMLIANEQLLLQERAKAAKNREAQPSVDLPEDVGQTSVGLRKSPLINVQLNQDGREDNGEVTCQQIRTSLKENRNNKI